MKTPRFFPLALVLLALVALPTGTLIAGTQPLDGATFEGTVTEKGKTKGDKDTLIFEHGTFVSTACVPYGFNKAAYSAKKAKNAVDWSAEVPSEKHEGEKIAWSGSVTGQSLTAKMTWHKKNGKSVEYEVQASRK